MWKFLQLLLLEPGNVLLLQTAPSARASQKVVPRKCKNARSSGLEILLIIQFDVSVDFCRWKEVRHSEDSSSSDFKWIVISINTEGCQCFNQLISANMYLCGRIFKPFQGCNFSEISNQIIYALPAMHGRVKHWTTIDTSKLWPFQSILGPRELLNFDGFISFRGKRGRRPFFVFHGRKTWLAGHYLWRWCELGTELVNFFPWNPGLVMTFWSLKTCPWRCLKTE